MNTGSGHDHGNDGEYTVVIAGKKIKKGGK